MARMEPMASPSPEAPLTRRALSAARAREAAAARAREDAAARARRDRPPALRRTVLSAAGTPVARHARRAPRRWRSVVAGTALVATFLLASSAGVTAALMPDLQAPVAAATPAAEPEEIRAVIAAPGSSGGEQTSDPPLPATTPPPVESVTGTQLCDDPDVAAALAAGNDAAVIAAAGGAEPFRAAVAAGAAGCIRLDDPARTWVVVNKLRPYTPVDYVPQSLVTPEGVRSVDTATLRADAAAALSAMVAAAAAAGAGEIGIESAYRSYQTQHSSYSAQVSMRGTEQADLVSARPGHSEHQSGLGVDVIPCDGQCRTIDDLAASPQGAWVAQHAWEYGWIVRYVDGATGVSGYLPEPWHLRYIGPELARAYHEGGWKTLEEFFGLPPAPSYAG